MMIPKGGFRSRIHNWLTGFECESEDEDEEEEEDEAIMMGRRWGIITACFLGCLRETASALFRGLDYDCWGATSLPLNLG